MSVIKKAVLERNLPDLLNELLFEQVPFVFDSEWNLYRQWRFQLAHALGVDPCELTVIGSAAVGVSLNPDGRLRPFDSSSDVDVAVISEHRFSEAWHHLRGLDMTLDTHSPGQRAALRAHKSHYVYWGCIATDKILSLLPFARAWMAARSELSAVAPTTEREINFRIYKDLRALRAYQLRGLEQLRTTLLNPEGESNAELS
jgi:hypothetical protein